METTQKVSGQSFDLSRFKTYFRAYSTANSRKLMLAAASCLIIWVFVCVVVQFLSDFEMYEDLVELKERGYAVELFDDPYWEVEYVAGGIMMAVLATLSGSIMFSAMHGKGNRQTLLTTPASILEKYLTYFLIYVVGFFAVFYVSYFIADVLRVMTVGMFSPYGEYARLVPTHHIFDFNLETSIDDKPMYTTIFLSMYYSVVLCLISTFSLGSILWQKASYLKTLCALSLIQVVLSLIAVFSFRLFLGSGDFHTISLDLMYPTGSALQNTGYILAGLVFPVFLFWLGYRRFKDTDLIERW